jgi:uncharacterized protein (TIGR03067 family)
VKDIACWSSTLTLLVCPAWSEPAATSVPSESPPRIARRLAESDELRAARQAAKLQGNWAATFGKYNGARWSPGKVLGCRMTIEGESYRVKFGESGEAGTYRLPSSPTGHALDLLPTTGPPTGELVRAVYQVDADCLMLCLAAPGQQRPVDFSAETGSEQILIVLRPAKP